MRSVSPAMAALLATGGPFFVADLYTFTLPGYVVARYTSADVDIAVNGAVYSSQGPLFSRGKTKVSLGLDVDTLDISIYPRTGTLGINGQQWVTLARSGGLDGARVLLEKLIASDWSDTSAGTIPLFAGRVAEVDPSRTEIRLQVKNDFELLDIMMPRNLYQPGCTHTLYGGGCGLNRAALGVNTTVSGGSTLQINASALTHAPGHFALGTIQFLTGRNAGLTRSIRDSQPGVLTLSYPLPTPCVAGDGFIVYPGCDKQMSTCQTKFNNVIHFRGFPYVPPPESAL